MLFLVEAKKLLDTHELRSLTFRRNWFCLGLKGLLLKKKRILLESGCEVQ